MGEKFKGEPRKASREDLKPEVVYPENIYGDEIKISPKVTNLGAEEHRTSTPEDEPMDLENGENSNSK